MNNTLTWDLLTEFGFTPDPEVMSDIRPGLSFDFGNFKLSASAVTCRHYQPVVFFTGVLASKRTLAEIAFEMPRIVTCREEATAIIAYHLDKACSGRVFQPARPAEWLVIGREHRHLLPWEQEKAAYDARPHCIVERDWLRLALKNLAALIEKADDTTEVVFAFDGSVLTMKCSGKVFPLGATGNAWTAQFVIPAGKLRRLPKRLMQGLIEISVREGRLHIGRNCFDGAKEVLP